jgi:hypothetical protein
LKKGVQTDKIEEKQIENSEKNIDDEIKEE